MVPKSNEVSQQAGFNGVHKFGVTPPLTGGGNWLQKINYLCKQKWRELEGFMGMSGREG